MSDRTWFAAIAQCRAALATAKKDYEQAALRVLSAEKRLRELNANAPREEIPEAWRPRLVGETRPLFKVIPGGKQS